MAVMYNFKCHTCGGKFEQRLSYDHYDHWRKGSKDLVMCPHCESFGDIKRILTLVDIPGKKVHGLTKGNYHKPG